MAKINSNNFNLANGKSLMLNKEELIKNKQWKSFFSNYPLQDLVSGSRKNIGQESLSTANNNDICRLSMKWSHINPLIANIENPQAPKLASFCQYSAFDLDHLDEERRQWIVEWLYADQEFEYNKNDLEECLALLAQIDAEDELLARYYPNKKRFSLKNLDLIMPALNYFLKSCNFANAVINAAHRGRFELITVVMKLPFATLLNFFKPHDGYHNALAMDDVFFHYGHKCTKGKTNVFLLPNPSHLEAATPVAAGFCFGQDDSIGVFLHGDSGFMGQGVVYEYFNLSTKKGYSSNGNLHIICNNQIGFTTKLSPSEVIAAAAVGKIHGLPIVHINGTKIKECLRGFRLALAYIREFKSDIILNIIGTRRYGHNEADSSAIFNPTMNQKSSVESVFEGACNDLNMDGKVFVKKAHDYVKRQFKLEARFDLGPLVAVSQKAEIKPMKTQDISRYLNGLYDFANINMHHVFAKRKDQVLQLIEKKQIDWIDAEALAFAYLCDCGVRVRLSGEDVQRGTFAERFTSVVDQKSGKIYSMFAKVNNKLRPQIYNSSLCEFATLGFEYGFSMARRGLCIWEAQFGDFANEADVIIQEFVISGFKKWQNYSNLVVMMPHGAEGGGANHSSSRIENILNYADEESFMVAFPTNAANFYHLLLRQVNCNVPCFLLSPKKFLHSNNMLSSYSNITNGKFMPLQQFKASNDVRQVVFSYGQTFVALKQYVEDNKIPALVIAINQISPFPLVEVAEVLSSYSDCYVIFAQDEPINQGIASYVANFMINECRRFNIKAFHTPAQQKDGIVLRSFDSFSVIGRLVSSYSSTADYGNFVISGKCMQDLLFAGLNNS